MKVKKQWTVLRFEARGAGASLAWHETLEDANQAALGLAMRNPGTRYLVLEAIGTVMYPLPALTIEKIPT